MNKEKMIEYSKHYKSVQKKLSVLVMIFIIIIGLICLGVGLVLCLYKATTARIVIGSILCGVGAFNIYLGIKFNIVSQRNLKYMSDSEAARRYSKITGKQ